MRCIKCNSESEHSICVHCADELIDNMAPEELVAHALVGADAIEGKDNLLRRLEFYKTMLARGE